MTSFPVFLMFDPHSWWDLKQQETIDCNFSLHTSFRIDLLITDQFKIVELIA